MKNFHSQPIATDLVRAAWNAFSVRIKLFLLLLGVVAVAGCSIIPEAAADPTRYYVLDGPEAATLPAIAAGGTLAIRSIELPAYLRNSKSMVVRLGENEVRYEDFSRWAEPLDAGIQRILRERLVALLGAASVVTFPLNAGETRRWDLRVRVLRCEGSAPREGSPGMLFVAGFEILDATDGRQVARDQVIVNDLDWDGRDFGALARQLSAAVTRFADDVARNVPGR